MTLTIRRARPDDAAAFARMMGDPVVLPALLQMPYPSEDAWRARLSEAQPPGKADLSLVAELGGEVVGSAGLHPTGPALRRRHVMMLGISVIPSAHRQGVGLALMQALCDYADRWMGVLRVELTVFVDNPGAIALYHRFGFETEGRHRGYAMRDGVYADVFTMARLHPSPPTIGTAP